MVSWHAARVVLKLLCSPVRNRTTWYRTRRLLNRPPLLRRLHLLPLQQLPLLLALLLLLLQLLLDLLLLLLESLLLLLPLLLELLELLPPLSLLLRCLLLLALLLLRSFWHGIFSLDGCFRPGHPCSDSGSRLQLFCWLAIGGNFLLLFLPVSVRRFVHLRPQRIGILDANVTQDTGTVNACSLSSAFRRVRDLFTP
jgi:hypothetical protein